MHTKPASIAISLARTLPPSFLFWFHLPCEFRMLWVIKEIPQLPAVTKLEMDLSLQRNTDSKPLSETYSLSRFQDYTCLQFAPLGFLYITSKLDSLFILSYLLESEILLLYVFFGGKQFCLWKYASASTDLAASKYRAFKGISTVLWKNSSLISRQA